MAVLASIDFFTVEVLTWRGLQTYYVLFFLHLETRRITLAGLTRHRTEQWITQMAPNAVDEMDGVFRPIRFALHYRDTNFCASFRAPYAPVAFVLCCSRRAVRICLDAKKSLA
jgi:putative transposase